MKILGIETSCDETALCLMEADGGLLAPKFRVLETALFSQIEIHKEFGGVFPAVAKREHAKKLVPLMSELLKNQQTVDWKNPEINWQKIEEILNREYELFSELKKYVEENFVVKNLRPSFEMITVTSGPGLEPALWVGINFARAVSEIFQIPVLPVNHMEGHITSVLLEKDQSRLLAEFPSLALLISGGHTEIISIESWGQYKKIGETLDDAVGEAYDKVARMIGLEYPGGPQISRLAQDARDENISDEQIVFPRPMLHTPDLNFSLSGLKTSVLYKIKALGELTEEKKKIIAKEFEQAVVDVLNSKTKKAIEQTGAQSLIVGGGVIANKYIRENLTKIAEEKNIPVYFPTTELSTDNAVMISIAGYLKSFRQSPEICPEIKAEGNLNLN
ncbi:MAG: tRNA (adenosine(37)-N6)-threonylcarbamoyltransferase complex transferase subunit TsaD [Candidatus Pacebacteria bacterium]|nr:tRNA (adenosine(37)-N6)-threonylcarbamoyltransferase complex transferase subunit TsaD [Candidatus Paceibacterota bacterium]